MIDYPKRLMEHLKFRKDDVQFLIEIDPELELFLGVGLIRNDEYIGFYMNLTAWNIYTQGGFHLDETEPANFIRLSLSSASQNVMRLGTHLVIIDGSSCDTTNAEQLSDPVILNYYRQFFIRADPTFNFEQKNLKRKIYEAASRTGIHFLSNDFNQLISLIFDSSKRVYSGVSAILDFEIVNFRPFLCSNKFVDKECRIIELFLTVDTTSKMQNGANIDDSIDM